MSAYSKETEVVMSGFTGGGKTLNQRGESMISLFIWIFLALAVMGGVVQMFTSSSQTTATSAQHTQQQGAILNALNRVSRDVSDSDPIVYASDTEMVVDVLGTNPNNNTMVERRRYLYVAASSQIVVQSKNVPKGTAYNSASPATEWPANTNQTVIVTSVQAPTATSPLFKYFDKSAAPITGLPVQGASTEGIARVDIKATANVLTKGSVALETSAVPRSRVIGDTPPAAAANCPSFTADLNPDSTVTIRWSAVTGASSYVVTRNGQDLSPVITVTDPTQVGYQLIDSPPSGANTNIFQYGMKVTNAAGTVACSDTKTVIKQTPPTTLTATLLPLTTFNAPNDPKSTAWTAAGQLTQVQLNWQAVTSGSGYQVFRQQKDASGNLMGTQRALIYSTNDPTVTTYTSTIASGDDGKNWEWSIDVLASTSTNSDSNRVTTLTYPTPVTVIKATAPAFNRNHIDWTGHNGGIGSLGYDIYRSPIDPAGTPAVASYTKIGSTPAAVQTFDDNTPELGSTYWYYVVAKNTSGFSNQFTAAKATQLQFPPDPVMKTAVVAGDGGSQDIADGQNRVNWTASKSAVGYMVQRANLTATSIVCLTGANCSATDTRTAPTNPVAPDSQYGYFIPGSIPATTTSYVDSSSAVTPASRYTYAAGAYNSTGDSPRLAAFVAITQRPAAPTLNKTADPTLATTKTSLSWDQYAAGSWCNTSADPANLCTYVNTKFNVSGAKINSGSVTGGTYDWMDQDWGRHYSYSMTAQNNAFYNGGVSNASNMLTADTYPGDFGLTVQASDPNGNNSQRYVFDTTAITTNTNETYHTLGSQGAQYFSIGWGNSAGARQYDWVRDSGKNGAIGTAAVFMPTTTLISGTVKSGSGNWTWDYAAPGTTYWSAVTATSIENNLQRPKGGDNPTTTPADLPQQGYQQLVCSGSWDKPPNQILTSADAANYAKRSYAAQSYGSRLVNFNKAPKYGSWTSTYVVGKFQDASKINVAADYYWTDSIGNKWFVEPQLKGALSYYNSGYAYNIAWNAPVPWSGTDAGGVQYLSSNNPGQAPHRLNVGTGMQIYNTLNGNPALNSYDILTVIDEQATRSTCGPTGTFQEPSDACYEWTGQGVCTTTNQYGSDGRPRWFTK